MNVKQRNPVIEAVLSLFIPLYILYWYYVVTHEMRASGVANVPRVRMLLAPVVAALVGVLFSFVIMLGGDANAGTNIVGILIGLVSVGLAITLPIFFVVRFAGAVDRVTGGNDKVILILLELFLTPIAVYIAQDKLNTAGTTTPMAPGAAAPVNPIAYAAPVNPVYSAAPANQPTAPAPNNPVTTHNPEEPLAPLPPQPQPPTNPIY